MVRNLSRLVGVLLLAALLAPASAALCAGFGTCGPESNQHSCCKTPRITECDCAQSAAQAHDDAEPARREGPSAPHLAPSPLETVIVSPGSAIDRTVPADLAPPLDTGGRLSLLSILVV